MVLLFYLTLKLKFSFKISPQIFERATKFSFEDRYIWQQFFLVLACSKQQTRALGTLGAMEDLTSQVENCLIAAKVCFQNLGKINEGIRWAKKGLEAFQGSSESTDDIAFMESR